MRPICVNRTALLAILALVLVAAAAIASCGTKPRNFWFDEPAADADKHDMDSQNDKSCWIATASNMLAAAGYNYGNGDIAESANAIYDSLLVDLAAAAKIAVDSALLRGGFVDVAVCYWLESNPRHLGGNEHRFARVMGSKLLDVAVEHPDAVVRARFQPWEDPLGPVAIANTIRASTPVGFTVHHGNPGEPSGSHALTVWGDGGWRRDEQYGRDAKISRVPDRLLITDSDRDGRRNEPVHATRYHRPDDKPVWLLNHAKFQPGYIGTIYTLEETNHPDPQKLTTGCGAVMTILFKSDRVTDVLPVKLVSSGESLFRVARPRHSARTGSARRSATQRGSTTPARLFRRNSDFEPFDTLAASRNRGWLQIPDEPHGYRFSDLFVESVYFGLPQVSLGLLRESPSPELDTLSLDLVIGSKPVEGNAFGIENVTGGYMVFAFDVFEWQSKRLQRLGEYRVLYQYRFDEDPEMHYLLVRGDSPLRLRDLRIGHSFGYVPPESLERFSGWIRRDGVFDLTVNTGWQTVEIDLDGMLPYPSADLLEDPGAYVRSVPDTMHFAPQRGTPRVMARVTP